MRQKTGSRAKSSVNEEKVQEWHKPVMKQFKRRRVYKNDRYKNNTWAIDLAELRSLSSKTWSAKYFLYLIDVFTKYAWIKPFERLKKS